MNRRIAFKKNYFHFLSGLTESRIVRIAMYLAIGSIIILLCWFIINSLMLDASTLLGVISLVAIPLFVIVAVFVGLEKIAEISCMKGVEWVGKMTLRLFDWVLVNIQKFCGIDVHTNNHQESQLDNANSRSSDSSNRATETDIQHTRPVEPILDFAEIDEQESLQNDITHIDSSTAVLSDPRQSPSLFDSDAVENVEIEEENIVSEPKGKGSKQVLRNGN